MSNSKFRFIPIQLGENQINNEVQLMRVGKFSHPTYGEFQVTKEILQQMIKNHDARVRGIDLAIDYAHDSDKEAAGWIKALQLKNNDSELWALVEWTPTAKQILQEKRYRYLSADFMFEYEHNETLQNFGPVLLGAGLTNRPFIKEMAPVVELSEENPTKEKIKMDEKDKKIAELEAKIAELMAAMEAKDLEMGDYKKKLEESAQAVQVAAAEKARLEEEKKLNEKKDKFSKLLSEGKCVEAQRESFMKDDMQEFIKLAQPLNLQPQGHGEQSKTYTEANAEDEIIKLANEKMSKDKLEFAQAVQVVLSENLELKKLYQGKGE